MDWQAFLVSVKLAALTTVILIPFSLWLSRWLVWSGTRFRRIIETGITLPLVLPPTVIGFFLLGWFSQQGLIGAWYQSIFGSSLAFSFVGLLVASLIINLPFAVQPTQRGFESIAREVRESALCCGLSPWKTFWKIEMPLAMNGILGAALLTFTHTLGEFGVILMIGGNIPGETRTLSIAIFDQVEAFNESAATTMSLVLLMFSLFIISCLFLLSQRRP
ncbi:MAG: molybdate transport system permease protein [Gammaproteobacteria bacterium]|jgi:molybdate transport system permease protein